jgi:hypothetical protein
MSQGEPTPAGGLDWGPPAGPERETQGELGDRVAVVEVVRGRE